MERGAFMLNGSCHFEEPVAMRFVELWTQFVIYHLLVLVEPLLFFRLKHGNFDSGSEDRAEGELFEFVVRTEGQTLVGFGLF